MWLLLTHMHAWKHECIQKGGNKAKERRASYSGVRGKVEYDGERVSYGRGKRERKSERQRERERERVLCERESCDVQMGKKMMENDVIMKKVMRWRE